MLIDELATSRPGHPGSGLNWTVPRLAEEIHAFVQPWRVSARGCADDSIFAKVVSQMSGFVPRTESATSAGEASGA